MTAMEIEFSGAVLDTESTPVLSYTQNCRTFEDSRQPAVFDIFSLDVGGYDTVIITDGNNKCMKSFFRRNEQKTYSQLMMPNVPLRIAKLEDNVLAVTVGGKQIEEVSVNPELSFHSTITTQKQYSGLSSLTPTSLAAGSSSPPCVDIIDRSGNVMRSISPMQGEFCMIQDPEFLCTTRQGNIIISDQKTKWIMCLSPEGDVVFNYNSLERMISYPAGVIGSMDGHILVADAKSSKVLQLSENGEFVRFLLTRHDTINCPWGIHYDERGRFFVSQSCHSFKMFTFKIKFREIDF